MHLAIELGRKHSTLLFTNYYSNMNKRRNDLKKVVKFSSNNSKDWKRKDWEKYIMYLVYSKGGGGSWKLFKPKDYLKQLYKIPDQEFKNLNLFWSFLLMEHLYKIVHMNPGGQLSTFEDVVLDTGKRYRRLGGVQINNGLMNDSQKMK